MLYTNDGEVFKDFQQYIPKDVKYPILAKSLSPRVEIVESHGVQKQMTLYKPLASQYTCKVVINGSETFIHKATKIVNSNGQIEFRNNSFTIGTDGYLTINNDEELFCIIHHSMCLPDNYTSPFRAKLSSASSTPHFEIFDAKAKENNEFRERQRKVNFEAMLFNMSEEKLRVAYINAGNGADESADRSRMALYFGKLAETDLAEAEKWIMTSNLGDSAIIKEAMDKKKLLYDKKTGAFTVQGSKTPFFTVPDGMREKQDAFNSIVAWVDKGDSDRSILTTLSELLA